MPDRAGGEIAHLIAEREGSRSPLGPPSQWPQDLRDAVRLIFPAAVPIVMFWGADYLALYNDAYASTIGDKHPAAFGRPGREFWSELWDEVEPLLRRVRTHWRMSIGSAAQASAQLRHIRAQYMRWCAASPSG
jgi:hypothetical protein